MTLPAVHPDAARSHCGRWVKADRTRYGAARLVCTLPKNHTGAWHKSGHHQWMWSRFRQSGWTVELVREWSCRGWVEKLKEMCGRTFIGTEDAARVRGWRIQLGGTRDQMCPQCGKPDPVAAQYARELAQSVVR